PSVRAREDPRGGAGVKGGRDGIRIDRERPDSVAGQSGAGEPPVGSAVGAGENSALIKAPVWGGREVARTGGAGDVSVAAACRIEGEAKGKICCRAMEKQSGQKISARGI